jgi:hypothetical protein
MSTAGVKATPFSRWLEKRKQKQQLRHKSIPEIDNYCGRRQFGLHSIQLTINKSYKLSGGSNYREDYREASRVYLIDSSIIHSTRVARSAGSCCNLERQLTINKSFDSGPRPELAKNRQHWAAYPELVDPVRPQRLYVRLQ